MNKYVLKLSSSLLIIKNFKYTLFSLNERMSTTKPINYSKAKIEKLKQDKFYFEKSNLLGSIDVNSPLYRKLYENIPVVLLLGWAGANDHNLIKYQQIYANMGYHTLRFSPSMKLVFFQRSKHKKHSETLIHMMKNELNLANNKILTHIFSNASCFIIYQHILNEIKAKNANYEFFEKNHQSVIFDCSPGLPPPPLQLINGIQDLLKKDIKNDILRYVFSTCFVGLLILYHFTHFGNHYFTRMYDIVKNDRRLVPTLSMYSIRDKLIDYRTIEYLIEQRKRTNPDLYVKLVKFDACDHVSIYPTYPLEYVQHLTKHLEYSKLDLKTVLQSVDVDHSTLTINNPKENIFLKSRL